MSGIATAIIGGAVISGVMGNKAAGKAARATRGAADASIAEQQRQFDLVRGDTAPYRDVGQGALYQLAGLTGLSGFEGGGGRRLNSSEQEELSSLAGLSREAQGGGGFDEGGFLDAVRAERGRYTGENIAPGENEFSILTNPGYENITPAQRASTLDNLKQYFPGVARDFDRRPVAFSPGQEERLKFLQGLPEQGSGTGESGLTQSPIYAALKSASESQYGRARENILATTPRGGGLLDALSNLEGQKASTMTQGIGGLAENEMARAFALATGTTPTALGGLGSAAGSLSNIGAAQAAQQGQVMQGLGYGAGSYLASGKGASTAGAGAKGAGSAGSSAAAGMCWVAEVLFGMDSPKTFSIRRFVFRHMSDHTLFGAWCRVYSKHGKQWAAWVKKNRLVKGLAYMGWSMLYRLSK